MYNPYRHSARFTFGYRGFQVTSNQGDRLFRCRFASSDEFVYVVWRTMGRSLTGLTFPFLKFAFTLGNLFAKMRIFAASTAHARLTFINYYIQ